MIRNLVVLSGEVSIFCDDRDDRLEHCNCTRSLSSLSYAPTEIMTPTARQPLIVLRRTCGKYAALSRLLLGDSGDSPPLP